MNGNPCGCPPVFTPAPAPSLPVSLLRLTRSPNAASGPSAAAALAPGVSPGASAAGAWPVVDGCDVVVVALVVDVGGWMR